MKKSSLFKDNISKFYLLGFLVLLILINVYWYTSAPSDLSGKLDLKLLLFIPELLVNILFKLISADVRIENHEFIFANNEMYVYNVSYLIFGWKSFLMYKNLSIITLFTIWYTKVHITKKITFTLLFYFVHSLLIVIGLFIIGFLGPIVFSNFPDVVISPTLPGNIIILLFLFFWIISQKDGLLARFNSARINISKKQISNLLVLILALLFLRYFWQSSIYMGVLLVYVLLSLWFLRNYSGLQTIFSKIGFGVEIEKRNAIEFIIVGFLIISTKMLILPVMEFKNYTHVLLLISQGILSAFHYNSTIDGDLLIGESGSIWIGTQCLGLVSMLLFASFIFLFRNGNNRAAIYFIMIGLVILHIFNIVRFMLVFIVAQRTNGYEIAGNHHQIYNIVIYIIILLMWVIWYEFYVLNKSEHGKKQSFHH